MALANRSANVAHLFNESQKSTASHQKHTIAFRNLYRKARLPWVLPIEKEYSSSKLTSLYLAEPRRDAGRPQSLPQGDSGAVQARAGRGALRQIRCAPDHPWYASAPWQAPTLPGIALVESGQRVEKTSTNLFSDFFAVKNAPGSR